MLLLSEQAVASQSGRRAWKQSSSKKNVKELLLAITLKVEGVRQEKGGSFRIDLSTHWDVHAFYKQYSPCSPHLPQDHCYREPPCIEGRKDLTYLQRFSDRKRLRTTMSNMRQFFRYSPNGPVVHIHFSTCPYLILNK